MERGEQHRNEKGHSEGDLRVLIKQSAARLANAEAVLSRKLAVVEQAELERNVRFSKAMMKKEANQAAGGLNFSNIDELRSLKAAPPPIVELVARCVSTLVAGDDVGDAEAYEGTGPALSARGTAQQQQNEAPTSARGKQVASASRLAMPKSPRASGAHDAVPMSARGERPMSARGERPLSARGEPPMSARGEPPVSARSEQPMSARGEPSASTRGERCMSARGERPMSALGEPPVSARGESPISARGERPVSARGDPPMSARGQRPMSARGEGPSSNKAPAEQQQLQQQEEAETSPSTRRPLSARQTSSSSRARQEAEEQHTPRQPASARQRAEAAAERNGARSASPRVAPVRDSDVARGRRGELISWDETLRMFGRPDFKWRLMNLSGKSLLDNRDLVEAVHNCLDLSTIKPGFKYSILPGRAHKGDRLDEVRARRELTSCLYAEQKEAGVNLNPLRFEEARYVNEVTGAMLIWVHRIFAQHNLLIRIYKRFGAQVEAAQVQVRTAKRGVAEREAHLEALREEQRLLRISRQQIDERPKPTEFTTPDQIVLDRPSPNVFFQNGRIAGRCNGGRPAVMWDLPARLRLPPSLRFYVRLKHARVGFPLPPRYPASQYLLEAHIVEGYEEMGPVAHVPFDSAHVVGLGDHDLLSFTQLVIEVPSTPTINPGLYETRLSFHPRHKAQLHDQSSRMRRIIVPVFASGGVSSDRSHLESSAKERSGSAPHLRSPQVPVLDGAVSERRSSMERWQRLDDVAGFNAVPAAAFAGAPATAHVPPAGMPQLAIPRSPSPTIGSPFNSDALAPWHRARERPVLIGVRAKPKEVAAPKPEDALGPILVDAEEHGYLLLPMEKSMLRSLAEREAQRQNRS